MRSWRVYEGLNASGDLRPSVYTSLNAFADRRNQSFECPFRCLDLFYAVHFKYAFAFAAECELLCFQTNLFPLAISDWCFQRQMTNSIFRVLLFNKTFHQSSRKADYLNFQLDKVAQLFSADASSTQTIQSQNINFLAVFMSLNIWIEIFQKSANCLCSFFYQWLKNNDNKFFLSCYPTVPYYCTSAIGFQ